VRKVKTCRFGAAKWFWPSIFVHFAEAGERHNQNLTPAVDWLNSSIGPGGTLLVPFHPFSVLVLWLFYEKVVNNQNLDAINIFSGSQTEHHWRCP